MRLVIFLLTGMLASNCFAGDAREKIEARNKEWTSAYNRGDIEAVVDIYDEGFIAIPPGAEPITDRAELIALFKKGAAASRDLEFVTLSLKVMGGYAYEIGQSKVEVRDADGNWIPKVSDYLVIWKRDTRGVWNYHVDAWWRAD